MSLEGLISSYGTIAVFLGCAAEGETAAFLGGIVAHRGLIGWGEIAIAAASGSFIADQAAFWTGRRMQSNARVKRLLQRPQAERVRRMLHENPRSFILGFRFVPGLRVVGPVAIGALDVGPLRFLALNAVSAIIWGAVFTGLGYHFGMAVEVILGRIHILPLVGMALAAAAVAFGISRLWR